MKIATKIEISKWLEERGLTGGPEDLAREPPIVTFAIPADAGRKTALARALIGLLKYEQDAMLYIDEWGVFPSCEDQVLFDTFRVALGTSRPLIEMPGHIFNASEFRMAQSLLGLVLYFFWGGFLVAGSGQLVIRVSHDEWLGLSGAAPEVEAAQKLLADFFRPRSMSPNAR